MNSLGALPDGRANAPEVNTTLFTPLPQLWWCLEIGFAFGRQKNDPRSYTKQGWLYRALRVSAFVAEPRAVATGCKH